MLGKRIKYLRSRQGITREVLAERAGLSVADLVAIEEENVERLPVPRLTAIADGLRLREAREFLFLFGLNGFSRQFQAYCLGLLKTGTVSVRGIFGNYRSVHEFWQWETHQMVIRYRRGQTSRSEFAAFLQDRDAAGCLEMDSAHFHRHYVDILAEEFPDARFICMIRDCFSWLDSIVNHVTLAERTTILVRELGNWMPFDLPEGPCEAKEELIRNFPAYIDYPLAHWAREYRAMLDKLPPGRSIVIRVHELAANLDRIAELVGVSPDTLAWRNAHLNRADYHVRILERCDPAFLEEKFEQHCGALMAEHFPGYALADYLEGRGPICARSAMM